MSPPAVTLCSRLLLRGCHLLSAAPPYFPPGLMVPFSGILSPSSPVSVLCLCHNTYRASQVVLVVKNWPANAGDVSLIPGLERPPGGGHGNPLQYSFLENLHGQRSLAGYSPWGHKALDTTERPDNNKSFYNVHVYQNIKVYTLNIHSFYLPIIPQ